MVELPTAVQIGKVRGIPIRLHLTFLLILPFFAFIMAEGYFAPEGGRPTALGYVWGALLAIALFFCVTLHELSHSLTAQRYGIKVRSITLLPIGGVSHMEDLPKEPRKELWVSLAGPLTNFVIGIPLLALSFLVGVPEVVPQLGEFVRWTAILNVSLGAFNLFLPAFPMDGGRILRAVLAERMPFLKATRHAAGVGRAVAVAMGLLGFFTLGGGGIWLLLIAFFIYMGATEEERSAEVLQTLGDLRVRDLMTASPAQLRPEDSLEQALRVMRDTKHLGFPVVGLEGQVVGYLAIQDVSKTGRAMFPVTSVGQTMRKEVPVVGPDTLARDALRLMGDQQEDHLVVLDQGRLAGILSKTDLSRAVRILQVEQGEAPKDGAL